MLKYSSTDINVFYSLAEQKISKLGEELYTQVKYGEVDNCLTDKINLLSYIVDSCLETEDEDELKVLVYFAMDYYNLYDISYSPFLVLPTTLIHIGSGSGGGVSSWNDILDKPSSFIPAYHTHSDEQVLINLTGITEDVGGLTETSFVGTLEQLLKKIFIKYQSPYFSSFSKSISTTYEVGKVLSGTIDLSWGITNPANVKDSDTSGNIVASENIFNGTGTFNLKGTTGRQISFKAPYTKNTPGVVYIYLYGVGDNDAAMSYQYAYINWTSRIWYGNDVVSSIGISDVEGFDSKLTDTKNIQVTINGSGYKYIFIPDMIDQTNIKFIDPNSGFEVAMLDPTNLSVSNPEGLEVDGKLYRTKNSLGGSLTINIQ